MKKRLLSAALALAMVLTLLPWTAMPAFADDVTTTGARYFSAKDNTIADDWKGAGWYYSWTQKVDNKNVTHYTKITGGVISGSTYYMTGLPSNLTNLTIVGNVNLTLSDKTTSFTADLYGANANLSVTGAGLTSVTVKDSKYAQEVKDGIRNANDRGTITINGGSWTTDKSLTLNLTDVNCATSITGNAGNVSRSITMTNSTLGTVWLSGVGATAQTSQKITANNSTVSGAPGNEIAGFTLIGNGSQATLTATKVTGAISMTGTGTHLQALSGTYQSSGNISLLGSTNSKDKNAAAPKVTIKGTPVKQSMGDITANNAGEQVTNNFTIAIDDEGKVGSINVPNAAITVNGGKTGNITMSNGSLKIQNESEVGSVQFGQNGTGSLISDFSVSGSRNTVGDVSTGDKTTFTKVDIPADNTNRFMSMDLGIYTGKGIKGGTFQNFFDYAHKGYLVDSLAYRVKMLNDNWYAYFAKDKLSEAIAAAGRNALTNDGIVLVGQPASPTYHISLNVNTVLMAKIGFQDTPCSIIMPGVVNGANYVTWTQTENKQSVGTEYPTGTTFTRSLGEGDVELDAQVVGGMVTKLNNDITVKPPYDDIKAQLVGNVITLSGSVESLVGGMAGFKLELGTDMVDGQGKTIVAEVSVNWDNVTGRITFGRDVSVGYGITFPDENTLRLNNGTTYTLNGSGLKELAGNFTARDISTLVEFTVSAPGYTTEVQKNALIDQLKGNNIAAFAWKDSPAVRQAINAAMASVTSSQVNNWVTQAQRTAWNKLNKSTATAADLANTGYLKVELVPYLYINVTKADNSTMYGSLVATATPYYRIVVTGGADDYAFGDIEVQAGRSLGTLATDLGTSGVTLTLNDITNSIYVSQDDTYLYLVDNTNSIKINHSGRNGNGLGTLTYGPSIRPTVALTRGGNVIGYYNSLQAAVDDTQHGDKIDVYGTYTGSGAVTMSGVARTIQIETFGNTTITSNTKDVVTTAPATGHVYIVQLLQSTVVTGNVTVTAVTGGSATVSSTSVKSGDVVTVTLIAAQGYLPNGVTVTTNTGTRITATGSGNSYSFTVPYTSFSSITVTPSFRLNNLNASSTAVYVQSSPYGTVTTTAANGVTLPGSSVGVTVVPYNGYRATGVTITTNVGTLSATRVSENYYTFTVPANATTVSITPNFSAVTTSTITQFVDVQAGKYYSNAVVWASSQGITQGTTTTSFTPGRTITRAEMVTFLWRAAGRPTVSNVSTQYVDVTATMNQDYYNAIQWAISRGITKGVDDTHFGPTQPVSRAQAVTFLWRYEGSPASNGSGFPDVPAGDYANAVRWAVNKQPCAVTNGRGNNKFEPSDPVTRGEAVTFLYRDITGNFQ